MTVVSYDTNDTGPHRLCRTCLHWKRRFHDLGTCWLPIQAGITVEEHDTCVNHTPKIDTTPPRREVT